MRHAAWTLEAHTWGATLDALGVHREVDTRDLGFGAFQVREALHGGYTTHGVTLVGFRGEGDDEPRLAAWRVDAQKQDGPAADAVLASLQEAWGEPFEDLRELAWVRRAVRRDDDVLGAMRRARAEVLGPAAAWYDPPVALADEDAEAIRELRASDVPIRTCRGCIVFDQTAAELLPAH